MATIALADDHILLRKGLASLIESLGHTILFQSNNGALLIEQLATGLIPDIVVLDINMPVKDGYETAEWIKAHFPLIHVLALSMYDDEQAVIRMIRCGAKGYILKDCEPAELQLAITALITDGYYHSKLVSGKLVNAIMQFNTPSSSTKQLLLLSDRETEFLKLCCSELAYKEIAEQMHLSPRTIDGYRDALFEKLDLRTRTGLVMYAIRNRIFNV